MQHTRLGRRTSKGTLHHESDAGRCRARRETPDRAERGRRFPKPRRSAFPTARRETLRGNRPCPAKTNPSGVQGCSPWSAGVQGADRPVAARCLLHRWSAGGDALCSPGSRVPTPCPSRADTVKWKEKTTPVAQPKQGAGHFPAKAFSTAKATPLNESLFSLTAPHEREFPQSAPAHPHPGELPRNRPTGRTRLLAGRRDPAAARYSPPGC